MTENEKFDQSKGGSRERILRSVRNNTPSPVDLPAQLHFDQSVLDLKDRFAFHLDSVGGVARFFNSREEAISALPESGNGVLVRNLISGKNTLSDETEPDVTVVEARYAVAENGAVYVTDEEVLERNFLFLGQKLIALVPLDCLLADMHEAYTTVDLSSVGFGIFIAGPSATADIAQILVRGAHGPSEMEVWFYK